MDDAQRTRWLRASGVLQPDRDPAAMTGDELLAAFSSARTGRLMVTRLIKCLVHRSWQRIRRGDDPEIEGNVRTFWYREVKPVLSRVAPDLWSRKDPDRATSEVLASLIEGKHLLSYADFGFTDENWRNRGIGLLRPRVLVFAEKAAQLRLLLRLHKRLGVSFVALGGMPSACTSEFTVAQLHATMATTEAGVDAPVHLLGIVDHDPWGDLIARSFASQLRSFGLRIGSEQHLVQPHRFEPEERLANRIPLERHARTEQWLAAGGGIDGAPWGLSVESLPTERLERIAEQASLELAPTATPVTHLVLDREDPRFEEAVTGSGGAARVIVVRQEQVDSAALGLVERGYRLAIVKSGRIVAVVR